MEKIELHIIDDDIGIYELLKDFFEQTPYMLTASEDPIDGINYVKSNPVELVLLDLMMPAMDGFEVCKRLKEYDKNIPIIILTAKKSDFDKIVGLEIGADDYLQKPFNPRELLARIKTIFRRTRKIPQLVNENRNPSEYHYENEFRRNISQSNSSINIKNNKNVIYSAKWDIKMDMDSHKITRNNIVIDFTSTEFDLLKSLMENVGIVQSREVLLDKIRGADFNSLDRTIDVFISRIRQKLGDNTREPKIIKTVRSIGYIYSEL